METLRKEVIMKRYEEYIWLHIYEGEAHGSNEYYRVQSNKEEYKSTFFYPHEAVLHTTNIMRQLHQEGWDIIKETVYDV